MVCHFGISVSPKSKVREIRKSRMKNLVDGRRFIVSAEVEMYCAVLAVDYTLQYLQKKH